MFIPRYILSQLLPFLAKLAKIWCVLLCLFYYCEMLTVLKSRTPAVEAFRFPHRHDRLITVNFKDDLSIKQVIKMFVYYIKFDRFWTRIYTNFFCCHSFKVTMLRTQQDNFCFLISPMLILSKMLSFRHTVKWWQINKLIN